MLFRSLKALAIVEQARAGGAAAASSAGGLLGGSIISSMVKNFGDIQTLGTVAKYRILAEVWSSDGFREWMTAVRKTGTPSARTLEANLPNILSAANNAAGAVGDIGEENTREIQQAIKSALVRTLQ